ncbi:Cupin domain-containing protein [Peptoclostridium litorale DSM 5388]|uniref:Cupin 2 conserved barrel domain-containing protein n=1 Tax=Peptoclostridium litorale DSM 5388 TaxID=1121324 RepID=A0A069RH17_PEPLI|nr:cupin domain-containing protein [Peptoclostridium litorale]KDR96301.1 cupin 2 conserved barrel domain-containing protein [Peptoclostridium litorale DSM 5388]SIO25999.1 Cupin domain-containing protein [Peptoclostridium litorale DSM 5388]
MRKRMGDFFIEKTERLKDGEGTTTVVNFFDKTDFAGKGRLYGISIIEPNGSIGEHCHEGDQEAYYILDGIGEYSDNGEVYTVEQGDLLICRDGDRHSLKNIGLHDLRYIALILYTD